MSRNAALKLAPVIAIAIVGYVLALQGWKSRPPAFDMIAFYYGAESLLRHGIVPIHGDVSSYGSFHPPGAAWLMAPGMLLLDDPRLYEKLGAAALHVGTLVGIYFVARDAFGHRVAYLSAAIYGLSSLGLAFAGSLWPIGHPFFYVWVTFFIMRWATRNEGKYLAAALITLAVGMYDAMAITPLALLLPVIWFIYRPRVPARALVVAAAVSLLVWYPYLRFEADRGLADIRSQLGLQNIVPANFASAWCDPSQELTLVDARGAAVVSSSAPNSSAPGGTSESEFVSIAGRALGRAAAIPGKLLANFGQVTPWLILQVLLLLMVVASALVALLGAVRMRSQIGRVPWVDAWLVRQARANGRARDRSSCLIALLVPWIVLLVVAEVDRPERFFWLWPLQATWLAAFFALIWPGDGFPKMRLLMSVLIVAILFAYPLQAHIASWLNDGFSGSDPEEVQVVDYVASLVRGEGRTEAAIGYQTYVYEFMPDYHIIDADYKVGADFDLLLRYSHQIENADQCAEGVSPSDEYRIVQTRPKSGSDEPRFYFPTALDTSFHLVQGFDLYAIYKRD